MESRGGSATQEAKEKISRTTEQIAGAAGELRSTFTNVKDDVRDLAMTAGRAAREQLDPIEEYVREYPVRSLLMAVGAGMILGMIFRR
jgi:ElaB/YqjD/DUF883 family membrane-anchored ribosome-binding protein